MTQKSPQQHMIEEKQFHDKANKVAMDKLQDYITKMKADSPEVAAFLLMNMISVCTLQSVALVGKEPTKKMLEDTINAVDMMVEPQLPGEKEESPIIIQ